MTDKYDPWECAVFRKTREKFGGLSNMASGFPIVVNDVHIRTSEALYQACKFPHKPKLQRKIIEAKSPMTAKMIATPYNKNTRSDWFEKNVDVMRWCLKVKLLQNRESFSRVLNSTGSKAIVESSSKDNFWGAIDSFDGRGYMKGKNMLGKLLMELRDAQNFTKVDPLDIPDFLLYDNPITSCIDSTKDSHIMDRNSELDNKVESE